MQGCLGPGASWRGGRRWRQQRRLPRAIGHNTASPGTLARGLVGYKGPLQQPLGQPSSFMLRKGDMALSQSFKVGP